MRARAAVVFQMLFAFAQVALLACAVVVENPGKPKEEPSDSVNTRPKEGADAPSPDSASDKSGSAQDTATQPSTPPCSAPSVTRGSSGVSGATVRLAEDDELRGLQLFVARQSPYKLIDVKDVLFSDNSFPVGLYQFVVSRGGTQVCTFELDISAADVSNQVGAVVKIED